MRDPEGHVARLGRQRPGSAGVSSRGPGGRAFVTLGADLLGRLSFEELLEHKFDQPAHEVQVGSIAMHIEQLGRINI